ncbi:MAG: hypothetical protein WC243_01995 [Patescibacteria group bacterium]|jgi:hypothetical protein
MTKKLMVAVAVLVIVGLGAFLFLKNKGRNTELDETGSKNEFDTFTGSLKEAAALNVPMRCKYTVDGVELGSMIKGKNFKGSVITPEGNRGTVVVLDTCLYSWEDGQSQGLKLCSEKEDVWIYGNTDLVSESYVCFAGSIPNSEFDVPSTIEFLDMSSFVRDTSSETSQSSEE